MSVLVDLDFQLSVTEQGSGDLGTPAKPHLWELAKSYYSGTGTEQFDLVWSDERTVAAAEDLDLRGSLTDAFGTTLNFVKVGGIFIKNKSRTTGYVLTVGGDVNSLVTGFVGTATDKIKVGPGGVFAWWSPIDPAATVAGTGDVLQMDPGSNTITYQILVIGKSA